jgi:hypothetical protein
MQQAWARGTHRLAVVAVSERGVVVAVVGAVVGRRIVARGRRRVRGVHRERQHVARVCHAPRHAVAAVVCAAA